MRLIKVPEKDVRIIQEAVELHGKDSQIDLMIEEAAELILALEKLRRSRGKPYEEKIADIQDEIADVFLMSNQMAYIFGVDQVQARIEFKINRAFKRNDETRKFREKYGKTDLNNN